MKSPVRTLNVRLSMSDETEFPHGCEILLLEDDQTLRRRLTAHLRLLGVEVTECASLVEARRLLSAVRFEFALVDLHLPDGSALELLREGAFSENTGIVVMTAFGGIKEAVEAMRLGAGDYLTKPFEPDELPLAFQRCRSARRVARREEYSAAQSASGLNQLIFGQGLSHVRSQLDALLTTDRRLGRHLPPVLIEGETGTGKSVLARWIHREGPRAAQPFITINCATLSETLAESELFGHERGAFTDAKAARIGLFEAADGGTLFLDEIGLLSAGAQAKILTAIEDGTIRRVGGTREIRTDVRLLAATNRPLAELVRQGGFREDLFHRLNLIHLVLPPLRERTADLGPLARHLVVKIAARYRLKNVVLTPEGEARLLAQPWRGNVRELAHVIERALIFGSGEPLTFPELGEPGLPVASGWRNPSWRLPESGFSLDGLVEELIATTLHETEGNVSAAARRLGVTREFLRHRLGDRTP